MSKVTYASDKGGYQAHVLIKSAAIYVVLILLTLVCLVPIWILVVNATRLHNDIIAGTTESAEQWYNIPSERFRDRKCHTECRRHASRLAS